MPFRITNQLEMYRFSMNTGKFSIQRNVEIQSFEPDIDEQSDCYANGYRKVFAPAMAGELTNYKESHLDLLFTC